MSLTRSRAIELCGIKVAVCSSRIALPVSLWWHGRVVVQPACTSSKLGTEVFCPPYCLERGGFAQTPFLPFKPRPTTPLPSISHHPDIHSRRDLM